MGVFERLERPGVLLTRNRECNLPSRKGIQITRLARRIQHRFCCDTRSSSKAGILATASKNSNSNECNQHTDHLTAKMKHSGWIPFDWEFENDATAFRLRRHLLGGVVPDCSASFDVYKAIPNDSTAWFHLSNV